MGGCVSRASVAPDDHATTGGKEALQALQSIASKPSRAVLLPGGPSAINMALHGTISVNGLSLTKGRSEADLAGPQANGRGAHDLDPTPTSLEADGRDRHAARASEPFPRAPGDGLELRAAAKPSDSPGPERGTANGSSISNGNHGDGAMPSVRSSAEQLDSSIQPTPAKRSSRPPLISLPEDSAQDDERPRGSVPTEITPLTHRKGVLAPLATAARNPSTAGNEPSEQQPVRGSSGDQQVRGVVRFQSLPPEPSTPSTSREQQRGHGAGVGLSTAPSDAATALSTGSDGASADSMISICGAIYRSGEGPGGGTTVLRPFACSFIGLVTAAWTARIQRENVRNLVKVASIVVEAVLHACGPAATLTGGPRTSNSTGAAPNSASATLCYSPQAVQKWRLLIRELAGKFDRARATVLPLTGQAFLLRMYKAKEDRIEMEKMATDLIQKAKPILETFDEARYLEILEPVRGLATGTFFVDEDSEQAMLRERLRDLGGIEAVAKSQDRYQLIVLELGVPEATLQADLEAGAFRLIEHPEAREVWRQRVGPHMERCSVAALLGALEAYCALQAMPRGRIRPYARAASLIRDPPSRRRIERHFDRDGDGAVTLLDINAVLPHAEEPLENALFRLGLAPVQGNIPSAAPDGTGEAAWEPWRVRAHTAAMVRQSVCRGPASDGRGEVIVLFGSAGSGKSTIAMGVAHLAARDRSFPGGVYLASVRGISSVRDVARAISSALGGLAAVQQESGMPPNMDPAEAAARACLNNLRRAAAAAAAQEPLLLVVDDLDEALGRGEGGDVTMLLAAMRAAVPTATLLLTLRTTEGLALPPGSPEPHVLHVRPPSKDEIRQYLLRRFPGYEKAAEAALNEALKALGVSGGRGGTPVNGSPIPTPRESVNGITAGQPPRLQPASSGLGSGMHSPANTVQDLSRSSSKHPPVDVYAVLEWVERCMPVGAAGSMGAAGPPGSSGSLAGASLREPRVSIAAHSIRSRSSGVTDASDVNALRDDAHSLTGITWGTATPELLAALEKVPAGCRKALLELELYPSGFTAEEARSLGGVDSDALSTMISAELVDDITPVAPAPAVAVAAAAAARSSDAGLRDLDASRDSGGERGGSLPPKVFQLATVSEAGGRGAPPLPVPTPGPADPSASSSAVAIRRYQVSPAVSLQLAKASAPIRAASRWRFTAHVFKMASKAGRSSAATKQPNANLAASASDYNQALAEQASSINRALTFVIESPSSCGWPPHEVLKAATSVPWAVLSSTGITPTDRLRGVIHHLADAANAAGDPALVVRFSLLESARSIELRDLSAASRALNAAETAMASIPSPDAALASSLRNAQASLQDRRAAQDRALTLYNEILTLHTEGEPVNTLAEVLGRRRCEEAVPYLEEGLEARRRAVGGPSSAIVGEAALVLAQVLIILGKYKEALARALEARDALSASSSKGSGASAIAAQRNLPRALSTAALIYRSLGEADMCLSLMGEAVEAARLAGAIDNPDNKPPGTILPPGKVLMLEAAEAQADLALELARAGRADDAVMHASEALPVVRRGRGPRSERTAALLNSLGSALVTSGRPVAGLRYHEEALDIYQGATGSEDARVANTLYLLGSALHKTGDSASARAALGRSVSISSVCLPATHPTHLMALHLLTSLMLEAGDPAGARDLLEPTVLAFQQADGDPTVIFSQLLHNLGIARYRTRDVPAALEALRVAVTVRRAVCEPGSAQLATSLKVLGEALLHCGAVEEAESVLDEALAIRQLSLGPRHASTLDILHSLGRVQTRLGNLTAAESSFRMTIETLEAAGLGSQNAAALPPAAANGVRNSTGTGAALVTNGNTSSGGWVPEGPALANGTPIDTSTLKDREQVRTALGAYRGLASAILKSDRGRASEAVKLLSRCLALAHELNELGSVPSLEIELSLAGEAAGDDMTIVNALQPPLEREMQAQAAALGSVLPAGMTAGLEVQELTRLLGAAERIIGTGRTLPGLRVLRLVVPAIAKAAGKKSDLYHRASEGLNKLEKASKKSLFRTPSNAPALADA